MEGYNRFPSLGDWLTNHRIYNIPCELTFVRWLRPHRKKRIAKKWAKKYGAVFKCTFPCYGLGTATYMCPCVYRALEKEFKEKPPTPPPLIREAPLWLSTSPID